MWIVNDGCRTPPDAGDSPLTIPNLALCARWAKNIEYAHAWPGSDKGFEKLKVYEKSATHLRSFFRYNTVSCLYRPISSIRKLCTKGQRFLNWVKFDLSTTCICSACSFEKAQGLFMQSLLIMYRLLTLFWSMQTLCIQIWVGINCEASWKGIADLNSYNQRTTIIQDDNEKAKL